MCGGWKEVEAIKRVILKQFDCPECGSDKRKKLFWFILLGAIIIGIGLTLIIRQFFFSTYVRAGVVLVLTIGACWLYFEGNNHKEQMEKWWKAEVKWYRFLF